MNKSSSILNLATYVVKLSCARDVQTEFELNSALFLTALEVFM